jgi:hypothetical protein
VGERRFRDSASRSSEFGVVVVDNTRAGETAAATAGMGAAALILTGLRPASLTSRLTLGEHALASRAPSTRRLTGEASIAGVVRVAIRRKRNRERTKGSGNWTEESGVVK